MAHLEAVEAGWLAGSAGGFAFMNQRQQLQQQQQCVDISPFHSIKNSYKSAYVRVVAGF